MRFDGNILVIGRDPQLFKEGSESLGRVRGYAKNVKEYHVISFSGLGYSEKSYDGNLFLWPTRSHIPLFWIFDAIRLARRIVRRHSIALIDAQDPAESGFVAWCIARRFKIPFRLQIHTDIMSPWYRRAAWKEYVRYRIARFLIPRADCIRVVSERIKNSLQSNSKCQLSNVSVLPIFTDLVPYLAIPRKSLDEGNAHQSISFVTAGRFVDKEKDFSMLIRSMRKLLDVFPDATLTIVGDGPDRRRYERMISGYGLSRHVILERWRDDLPAYLSNFDCFVSPSRYEGWGRAVLEAMAAGLVVVMTDVGLAREVVHDGENGIIVPVADEQKLLDALLLVCRDSALRTRLQENARKSIRSLPISDWNIYADAYMNSFLPCTQK